MEFLILPVLAMLVTDALPDLVTAVVHRLLHKYNHQSYMATNVVVIDCFYFSTVIYIYHSGMSHIKDKVVDTAVCLRNKM